jgi:hypothetical protein
MKSKVLSDRSFEIASGIALLLESGSSYVDGRVNTHDALSDTFKRKVQIESGAYRTAAIFDDFVIKFSQDEATMHSLADEADFIGEMRANPKYARHFPETHFFTICDTAVLIQEKIDMKRSKWISVRLEEHARALGEALGIDDIHTGNYGWKGKRGEEYPVFIDVDLRLNRTKAGKAERIRSWMVA